MPTATSPRASQALKDAGLWYVTEEEERQKSREERKRRRRKKERDGTPGSIKAAQAQVRY